MRLRGVCVSCNKDKRLDKLTTCRMCDSFALYCKADECADLQEPCKTCGQEQPGRWACGGEGHLLLQKEKTFKCVICDEFEWCIRHIKKCACGQDHYFCKSCRDDVKCRFNGCTRYLCPEFGQLIQGVEQSTFCDEHVPRPLKRRLVELVEKQKRE